MLIRININVNLCYRSSVKNFLILFEWYPFNSTGNRTYTITSSRFIDVAYSLSHMQPQVYTDEDLIFWDVDLSTKNTHCFAQFNPLGRQLWVIKLCLSKQNQYLELFKSKPLQQTAGGKLPLYSHTPRNLMPDKHFKKWQLGFFIHLFSSKKLHWIILDEKTMCASI